METDEMYLVVLLVFLLFPLVVSLFLIKLLGGLEEISSMAGIELHQLEGGARPKFVTLSHPQQICN